MTLEERRLLPIIAVFKKVPYFELDGDNKKNNVLGKLKSFSERRSEMMKHRENAIQSTKAYALISNHVSSRNSKPALQKTKQPQENPNSSGNHSTNTSFKLVDTQKSYRTPKTPSVKTNNDVTSTRDRSPLSRAGNSSMNLLAEDIRISSGQAKVEQRTSQKVPHKNILQKVIPRPQPEKPKLLTTQKVQLRSFDEVDNRKNFSSEKREREEQKEGQRSESVQVTQARFVRPDSESHTLHRDSKSTANFSTEPTKLSQNIVMSPPLVVFAGQNPIRLDPLLTRKSSNRSGDIYAYAAGTHNGIIRNYNEDRLAIVLNYKLKVTQAPSETIQCNFFGIYDGHGGVSVADYLKNTLHKTAFALDSFHDDPIGGIKVACARCEETILESCYSKKPVDRAGSCALFCFLFNKKIYVGNVGDSRAIICRNRGKNVDAITTDHKPDEAGETERIKRCGGQIYRTAPKAEVLVEGKITDLKLPWRVMPGRLSVSRTFGDIAAKHPEFEGIPGVVSAEPDVFELDLNDSLDYLILACDGVYDRLDNEYINELIWAELKRQTFTDIHTACEFMAHLIFRHSVQKLSYDNISIIFLAFKGFSEQVQLAGDHTATH